MLLQPSFDLDTILHNHACQYADRCPAAPDAPPGSHTALCESGCFRVAGAPTTTACGEKAQIDPKAAWPPLLQVPPRNEQTLAPNQNSDVPKVESLNINNLKPKPYNPPALLLLRVWSPSQAPISWVSTKETVLSTIYLHYGNPLSINPKPLNPKLSSLEQQPKNTIWVVL